jgi:hypothetical protein
MDRELLLTLLQSEKQKAEERMLELRQMGEARAEAFIQGRDDALHQIIDYMTRP